MLFKCRLWKQPDSVREFEHHDPTTAPDEYVNEYVKLNRGVTCFVECSDVTDSAIPGAWILWKVERLSVPFVAAYFTDICGEAEAIEAERRHGKAV